MIIHYKESAINPILRQSCVHRMRRKLSSMDIEAVILLPATMANDDRFLCKDQLACKVEISTHKAAPT